MYSRTLSFQNDVQTVHNLCGSLVRSIFLADVFDVTKHAYMPFHLSVFLLWANGKWALDLVACAKTHRTLIRSFEALSKQTDEIKMFN